MNMQKTKHSKFLSIVKPSVLILTIALFSTFTFAQSTFDQGINLYKKGEYKNAIKVLERDNKNISSLYYLGLAYEKTNAKKPAKKAYVKSVNKGVNLILKKLRKNSKVGGENHRKKIKSKYGKDIDNAFLAFGRYGMLNPKIYSSLDWQNKLQTLCIYAQNVSEDDRFYFDNEVTSKLKITSKAFPGFTREARQNGITGSIKILVTFIKDGTIGMVVPLNTLGSGLTESSLNAAKRITFKPAVKDGKPVNSVKVVKYDFKIY